MRRVCSSTVFPTSTSSLTIRRAAAPAGQFSWLVHANSQSESCLFDVRDGLIPQPTSKDGQKMFQIAPSRRDSASLCANLLGREILAYIGPSCPSCSRSRSPGFGLTLVAETNNGVFLCAECSSNPKGSDAGVSIPEDVGRQGAYRLLEEIYRVRPKCFWGLFICLNWSRVCQKLDVCVKLPLG